MQPGNGSLTPQNGGRQNSVSRLWLQAQDWNVAHLGHISMTGSVTWSMVEKEPVVQLQLGDNDSLSCCSQNIVRAILCLTQAI